MASGLVTACLLSGAAAVFRADLRNTESFAVERASLTAHGDAVIGAVHRRLRPEVVASLFTSVAHDWVQTRLEAPAVWGPEAEASQNKVVKSCTKVTGAIVASSGGDEMKVLSYMQTVCSRRNLDERDARLCNALGAGLVRTMNGDPSFNKAIKLAPFCRSFYTEALTKEANEQRSVRLEPISDEFPQQARKQASEDVLDPREVRPTAHSEAAPQHTPGSAEKSPPVAAKPQASEVRPVVAVHKPVETPVAQPVQVVAATPPKAKLAVEPLVAKPVAQPVKAHLKKNISVVPSTAFGAAVKVVMDSSTAKAVASTQKASTNVDAKVGEVEAEKVEATTGASTQKAAAKVDTKTVTSTKKASMTEDTKAAASIEKTSAKVEAKAATSIEKASAKVDAKAPVIPAATTTAPFVTLLNATGVSEQVDTKARLPASAPLLTVVSGSAAMHEQDDLKVNLSGAAKAAPLLTVLNGSTIE